MMWHWFFGKKREDETDEDVKAVGVEGMMGERVDVEVTDPRKNTRSTKRKRAGGCGDLHSNRRTKWIREDYRSAGVGRLHQFFAHGYVCYRNPGAV